MQESAVPTSPAWRALPGTPTALALTALAVLTVAVGLTVHAAGGGLGTALPPFFATWAPHLDPRALIALPLFAMALLGAVLLARDGIGVLTFLAGALAVTLLVRLGIAAARDGIDAFYDVYGGRPEAGNEYLPALPALDSLGTHEFLDRFAELSPTLPIHPSAHPPGMLLLLSALGIDRAWAMATLTISVGTLTVPLTYALARSLNMGEARCRAAALLLALSPSALLYGVTSTDALFGTLAAAAACLLVGTGLLRRVAGALALALASAFSWALLAIGAFATIVVGLRRGARDAVRLALLIALALVAFYGALYATTGFDPLGSVRAANDAYDLGIANARPYAFWLFGSPVAFAVALGLPTAWYAARALGTGNATAIGLAAIILAAVVVGVTKAETERIWLFMGPLGAVAAAAVLPLQRMPLILAALAAQALASGLLLDTIW
ncbi:MAG: hypothetical protein ABIZ50_06425 [Solirubrobacterales bacterium]